MLKQINLRPAYFIPLFILLLIAFIYCLCLPKQISFLFLNNYHTVWLDIFFTTFTLAGDGLLSVAAVAILILCKKRKEAIILFCAYASSGLAAQLIKHLFNQPRPRVYFEQAKTVYNHFVEGAVVHGSGSFPSGHTASAFAMATVFALLFNKKWISIIAFILAVLVGYSRIYLAEHFLPDVTAGAFTGVFFGMLSYYIIWPQETSFLKGNAFADKANISPE